MAQMLKQIAEVTQQPAATASSFR